MSYRFKAHSFLPDNSFQANNHTTEQWTAYYMKNSQRIDALNFDTSSHGTTFKSPSIPPPVIKSTRPTSKRAKRRANRASHHRPARHATMATVALSLSASSRPRARSGRFLPRSPTPPTIVVPMPRVGYKYTNEDKTFFQKFLAHELKRNPKALDALSVLAEKLAKRVRIVSA
jgi:hypothetical protein